MRLGILVILALAMIVSFAVYMGDVIVQLRRDVQAIRRKVNLLTASPNPTTTNS